MATQAQRGQANLPMTEANSAPQGGGPKAGNPATLMPPPQVPQPKGGPGGDPRDEAIQLVMQQSQKNLATPPAPVADGNAEPTDLASVPPMPEILEGAAPPAQGLGAPAPEMEQPLPMKRGGEPTKDKDGMSVVIGLGSSPMPEYEEASMGTPKDPPPGATPDEVADDKHVLMSEGELVVPANVVRYHGLGTYEGLRREALMGLSEMEQSGQINYGNGIQKAQAGLMYGNPSARVDPYQAGNIPAGGWYNQPPIGINPSIMWPPFPNPYVTNPNLPIVAGNVGDYKNIINPPKGEEAVAPPPPEVVTSPAALAPKPDPRDDATSPQSMAQAAADRSRSYDGAVKAAIAAGMQTDEEIKDYIQSGKSVKIPGLGWAFHDDGIADAIGRYKSIDSEESRYDTTKVDSGSAVNKRYTGKFDPLQEKAKATAPYSELAEIENELLKKFKQDNEKVVPLPEPEREQPTVIRNVLGQDRDEPRGTTIRTADDAPRGVTITTDDTKPNEAGQRGVITSVQAGTKEDEEPAKSCVIATHGVATGGFSPLEKAKAEIWCAKTYHDKWYGEAFRRGYRYLGTKHVEQGTASQFYNEFKDFVAFGRGLKKGLKVGLNYYFRTIQFFITGLFVSKDV